MVAPSRSAPGPRPHGPLRAPARHARGGGGPVRVQVEADLAAARWGLHAWEDPFAGGGPAAPFWCEAPVALAVVAPADMAGLGEPLGALIAREGARPAGLRLLGGALLLEVEWAGMAAQMHLLGAATLDPAVDRLLLCLAARLQ